MLTNKPRIYVVNMVSRRPPFILKQKYGGMDAQQLKELKALQDENARLKRMFADLSLDHRILKDIIEKKL